MIKMDDNQYIHLILITSLFGIYCFSAFIFSAFTALICLFHMLLFLMVLLEFNELESIEFFSREQWHRDNVFVYNYNGI